MSKIMRYLFTSLLVPGFAPVLHAQTANSAPLTYELFLAQVAERHPERAIDSKSVAQAHESERRAGLLADPSFSIGRDQVPLPGRYQHVDVSDMDRGQAQTTYGLSQAFPWPGTLSSEVRAAHEGVASILVETKLLALQRRFEAAELFFRLVRTAKLIEIGRANLVVVNGIRDFTHEKFQQGIGSHMQFLNTHSEAAVLKANLASTELALANLKRHALLLIDRPDTAAPDLVDFALEWPRGTVVSETPVDASAVDLAREKIVRTKATAVALKDAQYRRSLPSIMASGMMMQGDGGMRMYQATVGVSVPLYSNIQRSSLNDDTALVVSRSDDELAWHERKKALALDQAESRIAQLEANLKSLSEEIIPPIKEHIESATNQFSQGKADIASIIDGRRSLLNLQMTEVRTTESLALARLSVEKIKAGFVDEQLDLEVPQLVGVAPSNMNTGAGDGDGGMGGMQIPSADKRAMPKKTMTPPRRGPSTGTLDMQEDNSSTGGKKSGMGM